MVTPSLLFGTMCIVRLFIDVFYISKRNYGCGSLIAFDAGQTRTWRRYGFSSVCRSREVLRAVPVRWKWLRYHSIYLTWTCEDFFSYWHDGVFFSLLEEEELIHHRFWNWPQEMRHFYQIRIEIIKIECFSPPVCEPAMRKAERCPRIQCDVR